MRPLMLVLALPILISTSPCARTQALPLSESLVGKRMTLRVITADRPGVPADTARLNDILPSLRNLFKFKTYHLLRSSVCTIGNDQKIPVDRDIQIVVKDVVGRSLTVEVQMPVEGRPELPPRRLLNTKLLMNDDKPIILGGFPVRDGGIYILVLSLGDAAPTAQPPRW